AGLVEGDAAGAIRFKYMARDGSQVAAGDLIVTSGFGSVFPKGLPIGRIVAVEDKGSALFHFGIVAPAVDFARVEEVLLLTGPPTSHDLAELFTRGGERGAPSFSSLQSAGASRRRTWVRARARRGGRPVLPPAWPRSRRCAAVPKSAAWSGSSRASCGTSAGAG